jgi:hypothetical protein
VLRNAGWRGSDTGSWGTVQDSRPQICFSPVVTRETGTDLQTGAFGGGKGCSNNAPTQHRYFRKCDDAAVDAVEMGVEQWMKQECREW